MEILLDAIIELTKKEKIAFFLDDCQYCDLFSWKLIVEMISQHSHQLIFVFSFRPISQKETFAFAEYQRILQLLPDSQYQLQRIVLEKMTAEQCFEIICNTWGVFFLPQQLKAVIRQKVNGNPFLCLELMKVMKDMGVFTVHEIGRIIQVSPSFNPKNIVLPDTMKSILMSRIDKLLPNQLTLLKLASVIGISFSREILLDISSDLEFALDVVDSALESFKNMSFITMENVGFYSFFNSALQETIYDLQPTEQRQKTHRKIAQFYEKKKSAKMGVSLQIYHWLNAGKLTTEEISNLLDLLERNGKVVDMEQANLLYSRADDMLASQIVPQKEQERIKKQIERGKTIILSSRNSSNRFRALSSVKKLKSKTFPPKQAETSNPNEEKEKEK